MTNKYQKPTGSYISFMSNKVKTYGGINLAQGIPGFQPPAKLIEILQEVSRENIHQYPAGNGNLKLQQLIQQHYAQYLSLDLKDIMVTQGATEALSLLYTYFTGKFGKDFSNGNHSGFHHGYLQITCHKVQLGHCGTQFAYEVIILKFFFQAHPQLHDPITAQH